MFRRATMGLAAALLLAVQALSQQMPVLVFFEPHSAWVGEPGLDTLRRFANEAAPARGTVEVRGFADPDGGLPFNRALSLARAELVAHHLRDFGVPAERLRIVARGPVTPILDEQESRRVEVRLLP
jgi:outer membrane protein OmpA-like peptidoglycan-associated protein